jgi:hypothetical protein
MERRIQTLAPGVVSNVSINASLLERDREKLAVARGLARHNLENPDIRNSIQAPNGLVETGADDVRRAWETIVRSRTPFANPRTIEANPAFPTNSNRLLRSTRRSFVPRFGKQCCSSANIPRRRIGRSRTALALAYEYLIPDWF